MGDGGCAETDRRNLSVRWHHPFPHFSMMSVS